MTKENEQMNPTNGIGAAKLLPRDRHTKGSLGEKGFETLWLQRNLRSSSNASSSKPMLTRHDIAQLWLPSELLKLNYGGCARMKINSHRRYIRNTNENGLFMYNVALATAVVATREKKLHHRFWCRFPMTILANSIDTLD